MSAITKKEIQRRISSKISSPEGLADQVVSIILGGGQGKRLSPLTLNCCKPALSFGGRYKLVDVPLSHCINAGCNKIFVLSQFRAASLHQHIFKTYRLDEFSSGFIELLSAEQKPGQTEWFQGTADAVRQNLEYFKEIPADYFLILSGDQLYNMDFSDFIAFGKKAGADLVIATLPVGEKDAARMGILKVNRKCEVTHFVEKPQDKKVLQKFSSPLSILEKFAGLEGENDRPYLGSMGIYLFKREALFKLLKEDSRHDFGQHIIPYKVSEGGVSAYLYQGYWEDIGTIESYYKANMLLLDPNPSFSCYLQDNPIHTSRYNLPGAKVSNTRIHHSILCEGSFVEANEITQSILGPQSVVKSGSIIRDSYIMGNEMPLHPSKVSAGDLGIGENCTIIKAIIDKQVSIGPGVQLINKNQLDHYTSEQVYIRDGIIVVPRGARIPAGFTL